MKKITIILVAVMAIALSLTGCLANPVGDSANPPLVVVSNHEPTTGDYLGDYYASVTYVECCPLGGPAGQMETFIDTAGEAAEAGVDMSFIVVARHLEERHVVEVSERLAEFPKLCNIILVSNDEYSAEWRASVRPTLAPGVLLYPYDGSPDNDLQIRADACMAEGV